jgi:hypothetical protein
MRRRRWKERIAASRCTYINQASYKEMAISKLQPHRSMYLRGFDRRGAVAAMHNAGAGGFTVSGAWSDQADFAVCVLFDADDQYGHLYTSRCLPDFSLAGVTLDFDLALTGCQNPISTKFPSVPWGSLSYIKRTVSAGVVTETPGSVALNITSTTGAVAASCTYTVNGTPVTGDRVQLVYLSNIVFDVTMPGGVTFAFFNYLGTGYHHTITIGSNTYTHVQLSTDGSGDIAIALAGLINGIDPHASAVASSNNVALGAILNTGASVSCSASDGNGPGTLIEISSGTGVSAALVAQINGSGYLTAVQSGANFTVSAPPGQDGNGIELLAMHKTTTCWLTPADTSLISGTTSKLTGGVDPTSIHVHLDFTALGIDSVRQLWFTFAPALHYDSGSVNPALVAYTPVEWSAVFTNWTLADPNTHLPLKLAGAGSVTLSSVDFSAEYSGTGWGAIAGWYLNGYAQQSANAGDSITIAWSCQYTHSLYIGTALSTSGGLFSVSVNGGATATISAYADQSPAAPISGRRLIASGIAAGAHTVTLTVSSGTCLFDFLQAAVLADPVAPATTFSNLNCACDYDTGQTYQIPPERALWILSQAGFAGDVDFYAGVFFALKRIRNGGNFHVATVTIAGTPTIGDIYYVDIGGTSVAVGTFAADTLTTLAQRLVNGINALFVGVRATPALTAGQFTVTCLSPVNGFTFPAPTTSVGATGTIAVTGDVGAGNEGTWAVDASQASPLNRGFVDYLADFAALVHAAGQTMTVAFSQELLAPPDSNDAAPASVTFGFFNYLGTGYAHYITIGGETYTHIQLAGDGSGDIAIALTVLINAGGGDPNAVATVSANDVILSPRCTGDVACSASDGNGPGTLKSGAWAQRFPDGSSVLTDTSFGSWGAGVVDGVSGSGPQTIEQIGHGYITGNTVHIAQGPPLPTAGAVWAVTMTDANHYQLTTLKSGTSFTVAAGATTLIDLQTSQCNFNPATATAYLTKCYIQAANILHAAGLVPWLQFGEVGWWFYSSFEGELAGYASRTSPISIGTVAPHGLATGQNVIAAGVQGNTAANGTWPIVVTDSTHFTETGSTGNGNYVGGTGTVSGGGMAYYDAYTAAAAVTALSRALAPFWTQDDDPSINSHADANFLRTQVYTHMHTIWAAVLAAQSTAKAEWLLPLDVDAAAVFWTDGYPYPQGGRLNNYVNIPSQYMSPGSDIARLKIECLSFGSAYRSMDQVTAAIAYARSPLSWPVADLAYLVAWFNGGCRWEREFQIASGSAPLINMWAFDHFCLLSWPAPPFSAATSWASTV